MADLESFDNTTQLSGGTAGKVVPAYGMGANTLGGPKVAGRKEQVQVRVQNSGAAPGLDYRPAPFLPSLWKAPEYEGCPTVIQGGTILGVAGKDGGDVYVHQMMPANAGVPQKLAYGADDIGITISLDSADQSAFVSAAGASTASVMGNKPIGHCPTNKLSTSFERVYANRKYERQAQWYSEDNVMYPVSDFFMYGTAIADTANLSVDVIAGGVEGATRASLGFSPADIDLVAGVTLSGILPGDKVMPNPYLPGRLISVDDFVKLVVQDTGVGATLPIFAGGLAGAVAAKMGTSTAADAYIFAQEHIVGRCIKRQTRASWDDTAGTFGSHDIYADSLRNISTAPGLGLQGDETSGLDANIDAAKAFASAQGSNLNVDVVFINHDLK
jgi:hypothetical protein